MTHLCHAEGCMITVRPKMLFCHRHWRILPDLLKAAVYRVYVVGQEDRKDPSALYLMVQGVAVAFVARHEGRWSEEQTHAHLERRFELFHEKLGAAEKVLFRKLMEAWP